MEDERKSGQINPSMECNSDTPRIKQPGDNIGDEVLRPLVLPEFFQNPVTQQALSRGNLYRVPDEYETDGNIGSTP